MADYALVQLIVCTIVMVCNYRESQIKKMETGDEAKSDLTPSPTEHSHVEKGETSEYVFGHISW